MKNETLFTPFILVSRFIKAENKARTLLVREGTLSIIMTDNQGEIAKVRNEEDIDQRFLSPLYAGRPPHLPQRRIYL